jgi:hypothetical protein
MKQGKKKAGYASWKQNKKSRNSPYGKKYHQLYFSRQCYYLINHIPAFLPYIQAKTKTAAAAHCRPGKGKAVGY